MGKDRRKKKTHVKPDQEQLAKIPKTFVFRRGKVGPSVSQLIKDMRKVMLPFTAPGLKERNNNSLKDYLHVSGQLGVTHFLMFSCTDVATYFKVGKTPGGPTLIFKVDAFSLSADVKALQAHPHSEDLPFKDPPLVVLNGFSGKTEKHLELVKLVFGEIFPKLNLDQVSLENCRRVVLIDYDEANQKFEWRHYIITTEGNVGVNKSVKKVLRNEFQDLSKFQDISEYVLNGLGASESDFEDETSHFMKPEKEKTAVQKKSKISLHEVGPRMSLTLWKIQEKLLDGETRYHKLGAKQNQKKEENSIDETENDKNESAHDTEISDEEEEMMETENENPPKKREREEKSGESSNPNPKKKKKLEKKKSVISLPSNQEKEKGKKGNSSGSTQEKQKGGKNEKTGSQKGKKNKGKQSGSDVEKSDSSKKQKRKSIS